VPASLKQLERAVERANKHAEDAQHAKRKNASNPPAGGEPPVGEEQAGGELAGEDLDDDFDIARDGESPAAG
jgi:hypothetical protein